MATTQKELESWFNEGVKNGATHMIVVCDTYDWEDYPAYIYPAEDVRTEAEKYDGVNMQKIMEVYDLNKSKEAQIWGGKRVFNY